MKTASCNWCAQEIELAPDGAWQDTRAKACGCGAASAGEHEPKACETCEDTGRVYRTRPRLDPYAECPQCVEVVA